MPAKGISGRKSKHKWVAATNFVWGIIYRGELNPEHQPLSDVEAALRDYFEHAREQEPSESQIREYAGNIRDAAVSEA
jgi:hypothetical protein